MAHSSLKLPPELHRTIRRLHPELKRKIRAALADILANPACGKPLKDELEGYWSLRVGRVRIIYRAASDTIEIVAIGPRENIYQETARQLRSDK